MNNQLITKIITTNASNVCPELIYENPLIDREVAGALAGSFVKILCVSQQDSNVNINLRHSVLANIRNLCRTEPENHLEVEENFTKSLTEVFIDRLKNSAISDFLPSVEKSLDDFLVRRMKEVDLSYNNQYSLNPEVVHALLNLSDNNTCLEAICINVLSCDVSDKKNLALIKKLWTNISLAGNADNRTICDDISIKMKTEIEVLLLNLCYSLLTEPNSQLEKIFTENNTLKDLKNKCIISSECFQICCQILNYLFMHTNYNTELERFISKFVQNVKENCLGSICALYPMHLSFIVVLLDIDLDIIPDIFRSKYVEETLLHLKRLNEQSDLVLLLSHYPQWFHIYWQLV